MFFHKTKAHALLPLGCLTSRDGPAWEHVLVSLWGTGCTAALVSEVVTRGASADSLGSGYCRNKLKSKNPAAPTSCTHPIWRKRLILIQGSLYQILPQSPPVAVLPMGAQRNLCYCQTSPLAESHLCGWSFESCPAALGGKVQPVCCSFSSLTG